MDKCEPVTFSDGPDRIDGSSDDNVNASSLFGIEYPIQHVWKTINPQSSMADDHDDDDKNDDTGGNRMKDNSLADAFELSQRVERGDCIVDGPFERIEDFIDPETLVPFYTVDDDGEMSEEDEEDVDESRMERVISTLATQTLTTGMDESQDSTEAPQMAYDSDADADTDASDHSAFSGDADFRLATHGNGNPSDEDSTSSNHRKRIGLGYIGASATPKNEPL
jgi:hypothetical protein